MSVTDEQDKKKTGLGKALAWAGMAFVLVFALWAAFALGRHGSVADLNPAATLQTPVAPDAAPNRTIEQSTLDVQRGMLLVTALGVIFVGWTLMATRAAVREAEKATAAAIETARLARSEQRPWLDFEIRIATRYALRPALGEGGYELELDIIVRNVGRTPARNVDLQTDVKRVVQGEGPRDLTTVAKEYWKSSIAHYQCNRVDGAGITIFPGAEPLTIRHRGFIPGDEIDPHYPFNLGLLVSAVYRWTDDAPPLITGKARILGFTGDYDREVIESLDRQDLAVRTGWTLADLPSAQRAD